VRFLTLALFAALPLFAQELAQERPIPDSVTLMKEVTRHQREMEKIRENYTCHQITQSDELDTKGEVKTSKSEEREVFFVNRHRIGRLVKKDGVELSAGEQKSEQNRVTKLVEQAMKTRARGGNNVLSIGRILAVSKVSDPRRISVKDRDTIAFGFVGDPEAEAHSMNQSAGKKMEGTLWIDEADHQVARLEVTFYENFNIGGGLLVSIQKGTKLVFEQAPVGDNLWMPSASEQHIAARAFIFDGIRQDVHIKDFDFHKFNVDSLQDIKPPAPDAATLTQP
jgi:hypothetical protein